MRSYILAIALSMLIAAVYVFQNTSEVVVRFLIFERAFPQGVWEAVVFACGVVLMWLFSVIASIDIHSSYKSKLKEKDRRIAELEEERTSMLNVFKHLPEGSVQTEAYASAIAETQEHDESTSKESDIA